jgi:hypothetical protein
MRSNVTVVLACITVIVVRVATADEQSKWRLTASALGSDSLTTGFDAVDLDRERTVTVLKSGDMRIAERRVMWIRNSAGIPLAVDGVDYVAPGEDVEECEAWVIRPDGSTIGLGPGQASDAAGDLQSLYSENRVRTLDLTGEVTAGCIVGWSWSVLRAAPATVEDRWSPQSGLPCLESRYLVRAPSGWTLDARQLSGDSLALAATAVDVHCIARRLSGLRAEPLSPPRAVILARIAIRARPPAKRASTLATFSSWADVGDWVRLKWGPQARSDEVLEARVRELIRGAQSDFDKARQIAEAVQAMPYVALELRLNSGSGWIPRSAPTVLSQGYGECRDKANLFCTMLHVAGIPAWPLLVASDGPGVVPEQWPSLSDFDHSIVGIGAPWSQGMPGAIRDKSLGLVLVFDPTDSNTPLGELSPVLRGSLGLLVGEHEAKLLRLPVGQVDQDRTDTVLSGSMESDGSLNATVRLVARGARAAEWRSLTRSASKEQLQQLVERWLGDRFRRLHIRTMQTGDNRERGDLTLVVSFDASAAVASNGSGSLEVPIVGPAIAVPSANAPRRWPMRLEARSSADTTVIVSTGGLHVTVAPPAIDERVPWGSLGRRSAIRGDTLVVTCNLRMEGGDHPVGEYGEVRRFFRRVNEASAGLATFSK